MKKMFLEKELDSYKDVTYEELFTKHIEKKFANIEQYNLTNDEIAEYASAIIKIYVDENFSISAMEYSISLSQIMTFLDQRFEDTMLREAKSIMVYSYSVYKYKLALIHDLKKDGFNARFDRDTIKIKSWIDCTGLL